MRHSILKLAILLWVLLPWVGTEMAYGADFGFVVNKANPVEDIPLKEVTKIFKAEKLFWDNGKKIVLLLPETGSEEKKVLLSVIYKTSDEELKKFWLAKVFRNEIPLAPKALSSSTATVKFIEKVEGAIGIVKPNGSVESSVKIVKIDGKLPREPGYPLRSE